MGARSGTLTFIRFFAQGRPPRDLRRRYQEAVKLRVFEPLRPEDEAMEASGWCVMERPYDLDLDSGKIFHDRYLLLGFRVDRWRVPTALLRTRLADEEQRLLEKTGRQKLARKERQELKHRLTVSLRRKVMPTSRAFDVCWDLDSGTVLFFSHSPRLQEAFAALFEKTFGLQLVEDSPYLAALRADASPKIEHRLAEVEPMSFSSGRKVLRAPARAAKNGAGSSEPGTGRHKNGGRRSPPGDLVERIETTRFLGSEFLLWIWLHGELVSGHLSVAGLGAVDTWLDTQLTLQSFVDPNERVLVRGASPSDGGEAREAVRAQKFPVRARVVLRADERDFSWILDAPRFAIGGAVIPAVLTKDTDDAFLDRMDLVARLMEALDGLYAAFLAVRLSESWSTGWEPATCAWLDGETVPPGILKRLESAPRKARPKKRVPARSSRQSPRSTE